MVWEKIWRHIKSVWGKIINRKTSNKTTTVLDTASVNIFGLDIKITREVPVNVPYELTVVVPRAELRSDKNSGNLAVTLSSITVAHAPRFHAEPGHEKSMIPKPLSS